MQCLASCCEPGGITVQRLSIEACAIIMHVFVYVCVTFSVHNVYQKAKEQMYYLQITRENTNSRCPCLWLLKNLPIVDILC